MKYGFLFGAGAEVGYGLPSGGMFALDIFRQDLTKSKDEFKEMREKVDKTCAYASDWLPADFDTKNICTFGKAVYQNIIRDTVEHNRSKIIQELNHFDEIANAEAIKLEREVGVKVSVIIEEKLDRDLDNIKMGQTISFIDEFNAGDALFNNSYFAAFLLLYKRKCFENNEQRKDFRKILLSILQLQIGALSEDLSRRINDNLFAKKDEEIDFLDDLGEILQINYTDSGTAGMEYLLEYQAADVSTDGGKILRFAQMILESIYSSVLDYKSLIDSYWHYLYNPSHEWAKFCKISIFLLTVKNYIIEKAGRVGSIANSNGYYDMLKAALDDRKYEVSVIATTNYNSLIQTKLGREITYLNGSVEQWYDPYINRIGSNTELDDDEHHILVPLLFTQSGTKPMTSIAMSERYVEAYRKWKESDALIVVGFGFGADDEHINGIVRTLIDSDNKQVIIIVLDNQKKPEEEKKCMIKKLKLRNKDNLFVVLVDKNGREKKSKLPWTEWLAQL